jgi:hypothetical protein
MLCNALSNSREAAAAEGSATRFVIDFFTLFLIAKSAPTHH